MAKLHQLIHHARAQQAVDGLVAGVVGATGKFAEDERHALRLRAVDRGAGGREGKPPPGPGEAGFHLGCALYLGLDGKKHGMYRGDLFVDGEKIDDTLDRKTLERIHQLRDCPIRVREGNATGFGIFESVLVGNWPEFGLSGENSFI